MAYALEALRLPDVLVVAWGLWVLSGCTDSGSQGEPIEGGPPAAGGSGSDASSGSGGDLSHDAAGLACGLLGAKCTSNQDCGSGLECLAVGNGICQPAQRAIAGTFQCTGSDCSPQFPICLTYQGTSGGVCVNDHERACMCTAPSGHLGITNCPAVAPPPGTPCDPQRLGELPGQGSGSASLTGDFGQGSTPNASLHRTVVAQVIANPAGLSLDGTAHVTRDSLQAKFIAFVVAVSNTTTTTQCRLSPLLTVRSASDVALGSSSYGEVLGSNGVLRDKTYSGDCLYPNDSGYVVYTHDASSSAVDVFAESATIQVEFSKSSEPGVAPGARITPVSARVTPDGRYEVSFSNDGLVPGRTYAGYARYLLFDTDGTPLSYGGLTGQDGNNTGVFAPGAGGTVIQRTFIDTRYTGTAREMLAHLATEDANPSCGP